VSPSLPTRAACVLVLALLLLAAPSEAEEKLTHADGAVLGGTITYHLEGEAGRIFVLLPSTTTGPTYLPGGHVLDIGLDLVDLASAGLLGWATGMASVTYDLPGDVAFQGLVLYAQYATIGPPTPPIEALSNRVGAALALPGTTVHTVGTCITARQGHSVTPLADGTALVAGGDEPDGLGGITPLDTLEIYDPHTQTFSLLPVVLSHARSTHTATLLADGRVLLLAGYDVTEVVQSTGDIYDPVAGTITPITPMSQARTQHTATLMADGRVLVVGGSSLFDLGDVLGSLAQSVKSAEVYDPVGGAWTTVPSLPIGEDGIIGHAASVLGNGQVLVSGGVIVDVIIGIPIPAVTNKAWLFDPGGPSWTTTDSMSVDRVYHAQVTLPDGTAMVVGGADADFILQNFWTLTSCARYTPGVNPWSGAPSLNDARAYPNLVDTGFKLVVVGGMSSVDVYAGTGTPEQTIEVLPYALTAWTASGEMIFPREVARAVPTDGGERVLIVGTGDDGLTTVDVTAETYVVE